MAQKKRSRAKNLKMSLNTATLTAIATVGAVLVVQGALAVFPTVVGTTSLVVGFVLVALATYLGLRNK